MLEVYKVYQEKLIDLNACDFGDLILHCVKIFEENQTLINLFKNLNIFLWMNTKTQITSRVNG